MSVTLEQSDLPGPDVVTTWEPLATSAQLRELRQQQEAKQAADPNSPACSHPARLAMLERWQRCRDVAGGTARLQAAGSTYLQRHPLEERADYERRKAMTELFNAFRRTVQSMGGLVLRTDPQLVMPGEQDAGDGAQHVSEGEERGTRPVDEKVVRFWSNVDGAGGSGVGFVRDTFDDGLTVGAVGVLTDFPRLPAELSHADEEKLAPQPRWLLVQAEDVISWRVAKRGTTLQLQQLVIRERHEEPWGEFGVQVATYYRRYWRPLAVYDLEGTLVGPDSAVPDDDPAREFGRVEPGDVVLWELWREKKDGAGNVTHERVVGAGGAVGNQTEIPFSPGLYGNERGALWLASPPLEDLAFSNLAHYAVRSDRRYNMHLAHFPVFVRKGHNAANAIGRGQAPTTTAPVGPSILVDVGPDGDFKIVAAPAEAFGASGEELKELRAEMGALGVQFLSPDAKAAETATAHVLDNTAQTASLTRAVAVLVAQFNRALRHACAFLGIDAPPVLQVSTEFEQVVMQAEAIRTYSDMEAKGQITLNTLWALLQQGNALPPGFNPEKERKALDDQAERLLSMGAGGGGTAGNAPPRTGKAPRTAKTAAAQDAAEKGDTNDDDAPPARGRAAGARRRRGAATSEE